MNDEGEAEQKRNHGTIAWCDRGENIINATTVRLRVYYVMCVLCFVRLMMCRSVGCPTRSIPTQNAQRIFVRLVTEREGSDDKHKQQQQLLLQHKHKPPPLTGREREHFMIRSGRLKTAITLVLYRSITQLSCVLPQLPTTTTTTTTSTSNDGVKHYNCTTLRDREWEREKTSILQLFRCPSLP